MQIDTRVGPMKVVFNMFVEESKMELDKCIKKHKEKEKQARRERSEKMSSKLKIVAFPETVQSIINAEESSSSHNPPSA